MPSGRGVFPREEHERLQLRGERLGRQEVTGDQYTGGSLTPRRLVILRAKQNGSVESPEQTGRDLRGRS